MRTCMISKEQFEPKNPDHFFTSVDAFNKFVDMIDPMESFNPEKREINWNPQERIDPRTGKKFLATHPAQIYAPDTEDIEEEEEKKSSPNDYYEPQEKDCAKCHRKFLRTKPAMKYCEECSDKGGELLE